MLSISLFGRYLNALCRPYLVYTGGSIGKMLNNELSAPSQLQNNVEETRLLYVDDDIDLIKITSLHLAKEGFAVDGVGDGVSMDEMLKNQLYDLVLLDLMLPNEDGLSICRRLQLSHPELPVIMITSKINLLPIASLVPLPLMLISGACALATQTSLLHQAIMPCSKPLRTSPRWLSVANGLCY